MKPEQITAILSEKEILKGTYSNLYLIYNRKSTDEPNNQRNSIKYQKLENVKHACNEKLSIAPVTIKGFCKEGIISEKHSGFKQDNKFIVTKKGFVQYKIDRPKFHRLVRYLNKGLFKGVIVYCYDRISRNDGDDTLIKKLIRRDVDIRFVDTKYDKNSSGELYMDIHGTFSAHHSRVTGEKVREMGKTLRAKGLCTHKAPVGYLNPGSMIKTFDPARAPIIKRIFELYATGDWSLADLARWANEQGLTMPPMRKRRTREEILEDDDDEDPISEKAERPIRPKHIHSWFLSPFYIGKIKLSDGTLIKSESHEALVSEELVTKIHSLMRQKRTSIYYPEKLELPYRGLLRCEYCKRIYTPYLQKGILYLYSRCIVGCVNSENHIKSSIVEKAIAQEFSKLFLDESEVDQIEAHFKSDLSIYRERIYREREEQERLTRRIKDDLAYLQSNKLTLLKSGVYGPESFIQEEKKLSRKLLEIEAKAALSPEKFNQVQKNLITLSELLKNLYSGYFTANSMEKEIVIRSVFSELSFSQNGLYSQCKEGISFLKNRFVAMGGPTTRFSELSVYEEFIKTNISELKQVLKQI